MRRDAGNVDTGSVKVELQLSPTLDDESDSAFVLPTNCSDSETAVEVSTSNSITANGERRKVGTAPDTIRGGGGEPHGFNFNVPADQIVTVAAKAFGAQSGGELIGHVEWEEMF